MDRRSAIKGLGAATFLSVLAEEGAEAQGADTVYELRVYHLNEGKLDLIQERFRSKETKIFERFGMHGVAYWVPIEGPLAGRTLIYLLRHKSRMAAKESWAQFSKDPEWLALKAETERDGDFVMKVDSTFMKLTDFSPKP